MKQFLPDEKLDRLRLYFPNLGKYFVVKNIKNDVELLKIGNKKYVLKLYPKNIDRERITFFERLQNFTSESLGILPGIVKTIDGRFNVSTPNGTYELSGYLENNDFDDKKIVDVGQFFFDIGHFLGQVHSVFENYSRKSKGVLKSVLNFYPEFPEHLDKLLESYQVNQVNPSWTEILRGKIDIAKNLSVEIGSFGGLPTGIVHGDFYPKNLLFDKHMRIVGLIDYAQAGEFVRCYEVIRAFVQTNKYLRRIDVDPENLKSFLKGYQENIKLQKIELEKMLDFFVFIQASDISFSSIVIVKGNDEGLKDYAKYRFENLVSLYKNRELLNKVILDGREK